MSSEMHRISAEEAEKLLRKHSVEEEITEKHFLFGRSGIFSFDECGSYYALMERGGNYYLLNVFERDWDFEREISEIERDKVVYFLTNVGYKPFMVFEITRFFLEDGKEQFKIEKVDKLGYFTDREDVGLEKVFYGDLLKQKMIQDSDRREEILNEAKEIL